MATDPVNIPLWLGMGLNGISVPSATIARIKSAISEVSAGEAKNKMAALVACQTAEAVTEKLQAIGRRLPRVLPVIDPHMILLDVKISSKPLILKALADHLLVAERVTDSILVENALWEREKTYSTGLGHGLAIPHCTSPAVTANTIAIMRLAEPVSWGAIDDKPVSTVILLAHSEAGGDDHLKVFARLSRLLMREAFRKALHSDASPEALADLFKRELAL